MQRNDNKRVTGRDPALTWEVPPLLPGCADNGELAPETISAAVKGFQRVAETHVLALVRQLLAAGGIDAAAGALPALLARLAREAAACLSPSALAALGSPDPRDHVEVLCLPGWGQTSDSCVVRGVAIRKNVAHPRMPVLIEGPKVVALRGALEPRRPVIAKQSGLDALLDTASCLLSSSSSSSSSSRFWYLSSLFGLCCSP
jgi:hypothetical protein